jgi:uncharacterized protein YjiS (DUF1127 family)
MTVLRLEGFGLPETEYRRAAAHRSRRRFGSRLRQWRRRARDRAELAALDDRMLADIGISRTEAEFLANKPFWRE